MSTIVPTKARAVIIGGGIAGCSVAYHLAKLGWKDIVLLERKQLTSGTTWHAAGLIAQLRATKNMTRLARYSQELYGDLEAETGIATGLRLCGSMTVALNAERHEELLRSASMARAFGVEIEEISTSDVKARYDHLNVEDVVGGVYLPKDGQGDPGNIALALAKGARLKGAKIIEQIKVTQVHQANGRVSGVSWQGKSVDDTGTIDAEMVVNCAGMWARDVGELSGVSVPLQACEHFYIVTEPIADLPQLPVLRVPDECAYYKEDAGKILLGAFEPVSKPWGMDGISEDFCFDQLPEDFDHFEPILEMAVRRFPALAETGIHTFFNGPESFTPDGNFILGEAPELKNFFVGAGFNAYGIAAGGGAGMALAEWVAKGEPPYDLWAVDIRRFGRPHFDTDWIRSRTYEAYGKHYTMTWPLEEHDSGRPCRKSPLYEHLKEDGAVFGEKLGWERPNWYADTEFGEEQRDIYTFDKPNWHDAVGREHKAAREAAVLFDQTSFAKFVLKGPDAEAALSWIAANDVGKPVGSLIYTQMLNDHGGIECDLTCVRTGENEYYIVTGTGYATHDFDHIQKNLPEGMNAQLVDVTSSYAVLSLFGPKARAILQSITRDDVSNAGFPFGTAKTVGIAGCPVNALRVTYVGELGWELHLPVEYAVTVYEAIHIAGADYGLRNAGYRAIETLRLEKGYRAWSSDIGPDHTPIESGLGFAVKLKSNIDFKGRKAVEAQRDGGVKKIMTTFVADADIILSGRETIYRNGERVGWLSSAGFGHTIGKSIGMGFVRSDKIIDREYVLSGKYELEVASERVPCVPQITPLYDPEMKKVKC